MNLTTTSPLTMTSREIAELLREGPDNLPRHDNVKVTIERLALRGVVTFTAMQEPTPGGGKPRTIYQVNKRDSYVVVAQLSPEFTARLVDRWQELEAQAGNLGIAGEHRRALDALRRVHQVADAEVERATRHDFYRPDSPRAQERIAASVADVAARHGLDPAAVRMGLSQNVEHVMAQVYGDPYAIRAIDREKARIDAEVSRRLAAARKPSRRRR